MRAHTSSQSPVQAGFRLRVCSHASGARPWEIRALPGAGFQRWAGLCGGQKLALLEGESPAPLKHMATREASRGAAQAKVQGRRAGRPTPGLAPCRGACPAGAGGAEDGGGVVPWGPVVQMLAPAGRQVLGGVCGSRPSAWEGVCLQPHTGPGGRTGVLCAAAGLHDVQSSANVPGILGKIREGASRRSWEGRAVGWHLGRGRHVGLTLCLPSACLPHGERQRRLLSEPGRGRGQAEPEPTLTCASQ